MFKAEAAAMLPPPASAAGLAHAGAQGRETDVGLGSSETPRATAGSSKHVSHARDNQASAASLAAVSSAALHTLTAASTGGIPVRPRKAARIVQELALPVTSPVGSPIGHQAASSLLDPTISPAPVSPLASPRFGELQPHFQGSAESRSPTPPLPQHHFSLGAPVPQFKGPEAIGQCWNISSVDEEILNRVVGPKGTYEVISAEKAKSKVEDFLSARSGFFQMLRDGLKALGARIAEWLRKPYPIDRFVGVLSQIDSTHRVAAPEIVNVPIASILAVLVDKVGTIKTVDQMVEALAKVSQRFKEQTRGKLSNEDREKILNKLQDVALDRLFESMKGSMKQVVVTSLEGGRKFYREADALKRELNALSFNVDQISYLGFMDRVQGEMVEIRDELVLSNQATRDEGVAALNEAWSNVRTQMHDGGATGLVAQIQKMDLSAPEKLSSLIQYVVLAKKLGLVSNDQDSLCLEKGCSTFTDSKYSKNLLSNYLWNPEFEDAFEDAFQLEKAQRLKCQQNERSVAAREIYEKAEAAALQANEQAQQILEQEKIARNTAEATSLVAGIVGDISSFASRATPLVQNVSSTVEKLNALQERFSKQQAEQAQEEFPPLEQPQPVSIAAYQAAAARVAASADAAEQIAQRRRAFAEGLEKVGHEYAQEVEKMKSFVAAIQALATGVVSYKPMDGVADLVQEFVPDVLTAQQREQIVQDGTALVHSFGKILGNGEALAQFGPLESVQSAKEGIEQFVQSFKAQAGDVVILSPRSDIVD